MGKLQILFSLGRSQSLKYWKVNSDLKKKKITPNNLVSYVIELWLTWQKLWCKSFQIPKMTAYTLAH